MASGPPIRAEAVEQAITSAHSRRILSLCVKQPLPVRTLVERSGIAQATLYRQVHTLVESGLLVVERSALTSDGKAYDLYRSRLRSARVGFEADKPEVSWEPNLPVEDRLLRMMGSLRGPAAGGEA
ncbi:MAG TPA: helix-turn-helix domain-containing protein [Candidatus Thermoplasmatota archaeon]|nr:helix-turn-helix domain-containing protein [Candidatus Thermoplasmatota archaeon]